MHTIRETMRDFVLWIALWISITASTGRVKITPIPGDFPEATFGCRVFVPGCN